MHRHLSNRRHIPKGTKLDMVHMRSLKSTVLVAHDLHVAPSTVRRVVALAAKTGVVARQSTGRPRKLNGIHASVSRATHHLAICSCRAVSGGPSGAHPRPLAAATAECSSTDTWGGCVYSDNIEGSSGTRLDPKKGV
jgi:hypothetical protein